MLVQGLTPSTKYYYQVVAGDAAPPARPDGSFLTLPTADAYRNAQHNPKGLFNFRFEFGTGNNQRPAGEGPWPPAFKTMLEQLQDKVYFHIQNGDFIYEEKRDYRVEEWLAPGRPDGRRRPRGSSTSPRASSACGRTTSCTSSAARRWPPGIGTCRRSSRSTTTRSSTTSTARARSAAATAGRCSATSARRPGTTTSAGPTPSRPARIHFGQAQLKAGSDILTDPQADFSTLASDFREPGELHVNWGGVAAGVPERDLDGLPGVEGDPNANVYQIVERLDAHRLRVKPAAKADGVATYSIARQSYYDQRVGNAHFFFLDTRSHRGVSDPTHANRPDLTMLGAAQKAWLMDGMKKSDADFFFVVSQVTFMIPHVGGTPTAGATERERRRRTRLTTKPGRAS